MLLLRAPRTGNIKTAIKTICRISINIAQFCTRHKHITSIVNKPSPQQMHTFGVSRVTCEFECELTFNASHPSTAGKKVRPILWKLLHKQKRTLPPTIRQPAWVCSLTTPPANYALLFACSLVHLPAVALAFRAFLFSNLYVCVCVCARII